MTEEPLHEETTADGSTRAVWVSRLPAGGVAVAAQDLGNLTGFFGAGVREYEWAHSVAASDVPALSRALGGTAEADVVELMKVRFSGDRHAQFADFCAAEGIPVKFWSRFGE